MALACAAEGASVIVENVFENRFAHAAQLRRMGADIFLSGRLAVVRGGRLYGADVQAGDLRGGAALVHRGAGRGGGEPRGKRGTDRPRLRVAGKHARRPRRGHTQALTEDTNEADRAEEERRCSWLRCCSCWRWPSICCWTTRVFVARDVQRGGQRRPSTRTTIIRAAQLPLGKTHARGQRGKGARGAGKRRHGGAVSAWKSTTRRRWCSTCASARCDAVVAYAGVVLTHGARRHRHRPARRHAGDRRGLRHRPQRHRLPAGRGGLRARLRQLEALVTTLDALYDNAATGYVSELNVSDPQRASTSTRARACAWIWATARTWTTRSSGWPARCAIWRRAARPRARLDVSSGDKADYSAG